MGERLRLTRIFGVALRSATLRRTTKYAFAPRTLRATRVPGRHIGGCCILILAALQQPAYTQAHIFSPDDRDSSFYIGN